MSAIDMRTLRRLIATIAIFLVVSTPILAHTLYLKDGRVIKGRILAQNRTEIRIDVNGTTMTFQKTDIRQVDFEQEPQKPVRPVEKPVKPPIEKPAAKPSGLWAINRWTVAGRSAVLPGWGLYATGEQWKAAGTLTAMVGALGYAFAQRRTVLSAKQAYQNQNLVVLAVAPSFSSNPTDQLVGNMLLNNAAFNSYQSRVDSFNNSMRLLGLLYGLQIVHAYFSGKAYEARSQGTSFFPLPDGPRGQALTLVHYWTF